MTRPERVILRIFNGLQKFKRVTAGRKFRPEMGQSVAQINTLAGKSVDFMFTPSPAASGMENIGAARAVAGINLQLQRNPTKVGNDIVEKLQKSDYVGINIRFLTKESRAAFMQVIGGLPASLTSRFIIFQ